jgi:uncharacterized phage protein (TIGR01671 family)
MREVKFRAWDIDNEKMGDVVTMNFNDNELTIYPTCDGYPKHFECYEIMQYTGLKDKNGKEIYEGDIIVHKNSLGNLKYTLEVRFGEYYIETCIDACHELCDEDPISVKCYGFYFKRGVSEYSLNEQCFDDYSVIGNIYENPEIMEES